MTNENKPPVSERDDAPIIPCKLTPCAWPRCDCDIEPTELDLVYEDLRKAQARIAELEGQKMDIEDCDGDLAEIEQIAESRARIAALEGRDAEVNSMAWERGFDAGYAKAQARIAELEAVKSPIESSEAILIELKRAVDRTIERCAQVAGIYSSDAAEDIRALKDKPWPQS